MMLRGAGKSGVTTSQFLSARLPRFSARVKELREAGFEIATERVREGEWRYRLEGVGFGAGASHPGGGRTSSSASPEPSLFPQDTSAFTGEAWA